MDESWKDYNRFPEIAKVRAKTASVVKQQEAEHKALETAHKQDLERTIRELLGDAIVRAAEKGSYSVDCNVDYMMESTPAAKSDKEWGLRFEALKSVVYDFHLRGYKVKFGTNMEVTISWEE